MAAFLPPFPFVPPLPFLPFLAMAALTLAAAAAAAGASQPAGATLRPALSARAATTLGNQPQRAACPLPQGRCGALVTRAVAKLWARPLRLLAAAEGERGHILHMHKADSTRFQKVPAAPGPTRIPAVAFRQQDC
jgi:hypothetical protein